MFSRYLSKAQSTRLLVIIGQFLVLTLCIAYIRFQYNDKILPDLLVPDTFSETSCLLLDEDLSSAGYFITHYRANFLVSYRVGNQSFTHWIAGNGLDQSVNHDQESQKALLQRFNKGETYPCWYNPTKPEQVVLIQRSNWLATLPLLIPSIIALICIYFILGGTFQFVSEIFDKEDL